MRTQLDSEIMQIQDWRLREFCRLALDRVPIRFFEAPASLTGKWHPVQDQGLGGLVRHTKIATYFGRRLTRVYQLDKDAEDVVTAALILHDLGKVWEVKGDDYVPHELLCVEYLRGLPESYRFARVIEGVRWHMGPWSAGKPNFVEHLDPICQVVHLGDYVAAQKSLIVDFLPLDLGLMIRRSTV